MDDISRQSLSYTSTTFRLPAILFTPNPMNGRQTVIDIVVVLVIPLVILAGFYFWKKEDSPPLLSLIAPSLVAKPGEESKELGAKVKIALATLNSIKMDNSIFNDPVYQSLRDFPVTIATSTLGREYPFSLPESIREKERQNRSASEAAYRASIKASASASTKLDAIVIGVK